MVCKFNAISRCIKDYVSQRKGRSVLFLSAIVLMVAGAPVHAVSQDVTCNAPTIPKIRIVPKTQAVKYNMKKSLKSLQQPDSNIPDFGENMQVRGYMDAKINHKKDVKFSAKALPDGQGTCSWYKSVDVEIMIEPTIVIAKEVARDKCMRKAVIEHEMKHIRTDRQMINEVSHILGKRVFAAMKAKNFVGGPVPDEKIQDLADQMGGDVYRVINETLEAANKERHKRQSAVDTRAEYSRVTALCKGFDKLPRYDTSLLKKK